MAAEKLRDLSQPIDVALLDATVAAFYGTGSKEEVCEWITLLILSFSPCVIWLSNKHSILLACAFGCLKI